MAPRKGTAVSMAEALQTFVSDTEPQELPTGVIDDTYVRFEPGVENDIPADEMARLVRTAPVYFNRLQHVADVQRNQEKREKFLKGLGIAYPDFRGYVSRSDQLRHKFKLSIYPQTTFTWNPEAFDAAVGPAASAVTNEETVIKVTTPPDYVTERGLLTHREIKLAIAAGLMAIGVAAEDVPKLVTAERRLTVDKKKLFELFQNGQIAELEAVGTATQVIAIKPSFIAR